MTEPAHVTANRRAWTTHAPWYAKRAREAWASEPHWGVWRIPDTDVGVFGDLERFRGRQVVELGCGTAYVGSWFARAGADVTGVDITTAQLDTARTMADEHGVEVRLIEASAEDVPLPDECADVVVSEYGASIWCDPAAWIGEAARLLRNGGELMFLCNSPLMMACTDTDGYNVGDTLNRPIFGMHTFAWEDDGSIEFHIPHGEMLRTLRGAGFEVVDLVELQAPADAASNWDIVGAEWARKWPAEEIWHAVRRR